VFIHVWLIFKVLVQQKKADLWNAIYFKAGNEQNDNYE